ncbi:MAG: T9SS type A sorting domain-containing protein [Saprospiraceae bacterium]
MNILNLMFTNGTNQMEVMGIWLIKSNSQVLLYTNESFDEFPIVTTGVVQQPLPITLKTFEVKHSGKRDALLNWVTASEVNASHFEIERKKDSDQSWEYLASVEAANNTYVETTYEYLDNDLPINRSNETFYYHLKMVDTDGSYKYSEIRSLSFGIIDEFSAVMYPNPCRDYLKLETVTGINLYSDFAKVKIYNSNGNTVFEKIISSNGINDLDLNDLPAGAYNVQIYIANHVIVKKLMVIK